MVLPNAQHRRTHNLLLINKLLNQRDGGSPFSLILDGLEQSGVPLIDEYLRRAKSANVHTVFVSFHTVRKAHNVDTFVEADPGTSSWSKVVLEAIRVNTTQRNLIIFDALNPICDQKDSNMPAILSSFIRPGTNVLAVYHTDVPTVRSTLDPYSPTPLSTLRYLATTLYTVRSFQHVLARKAARDRSHVEPEFGLGEDVEGILQGLGANDLNGIVIEMEHRRKSGRGVREQYYMSRRSSSSEDKSPAGKDNIILLQDHEYYRPKQADNSSQADDDPADSTFQLGLTDRQRQDREGVVLPYFDAQKGVGEGGRILYDMGSEDDFDEEEDEI